jgi:hypothetical protein
LGNDEGVDVAKLGIVDGFVRVETDGFFGFF